MNRAERRIQQLELWADRARQRLYRVDIVPTLPPEAPAGYLLATPGDTNIYVGTGEGRPLRKIPTLPV